MKPSGSTGPQRIGHAEAQEWLQAGRPVDVAERQRLEVHLAGCEACQNYAAFVRRLESELPSAALFDQAGSQRSQKQIDNIQAQLRKISPDARKLQSQHWQRDIALAFAALFLVWGLAWAINRLVPNTSSPAALPAVAVTQEPLRQIKPSPTPQPQPQPAGDGVDLGSLPLAGFIDRANDRVLVQPVFQQFNSSELQVVQAVASSASTRLWLEVAGEAPDYSQAWLEDSAGKVYSLANYWDPVDPTRPGTVLLEFPAIPGTAQGVRLGMSEGWRLPIAFVSADQLRIEQVNSSPVRCQSLPEANICLLAAVQDAQTFYTLAQVLLQAGNEKNLLPFNGSFYYGANSPRLHQAGQDLVWYEYQPGIPPGLAAEIPGVQVLAFSSLGSIGVQADLEIPALSYSLPISQTVTLDLGDDPLNRREWSLDLAVMVDGLEVHFTDASIRDDGNLRVSSLPVLPQDGRAVTWLEMGRPSGIQDRYGGGYDSVTRQFTINLPLLDSDGGYLHGDLSIPFVNAQVSRIGPFTFSLQPNLVQDVQQNPPMEIGAEVFSPPATATPLNLDGYAYTGRVLNSGEALLVESDGNVSSLFADNPGDSGAAELVANLPGNIVRLFVHPDRQGLDYIIGDDPGDGALHNARFFTVRLDGSLPKELLEPLPVLDTALWSAGGELLFYSSRSNVNNESEPELLDLVGCRAVPRNCQDFRVPFAWHQDGVLINCPAWSTDGLKMAFCGFDENGDGSGGLYTGEFNQPDGFSPGGVFLGLNGPLQSPDQGSSFAPAWLPSDQGLVYVCEDGLDFNICLQRLDGSPSVKLLDSQSALVPLTVSHNGRFIALPGYISKGQSMRVRLLDLTDGQLIDLPETGWFGDTPPAFSPDDRWVLVRSNQGGVTAFSVPDGLEFPLSNQLQYPARWAGWVP